MAIPPKPGPRGNFDHLLTRLHRKMGYTLRLTPWDYHGVGVALRHKGRIVGRVGGDYEDGKPALNVADAWLLDGHRGKGLGFRMYDAMIGHAYHTNGVREVQGARHSEAAHEVHKKIAAKYGATYRSPKLARPNVLEMNLEKPVIQTRGDYKYKLGKEEVAW